MLFATEREKERGVIYQRRAELAGFNRSSARRYGKHFDLHVRVTREDLGGCFASSFLQKSSFLKMKNNGFPLLSLPRAVAYKRPPLASLSSYAQNSTDDEDEEAYAKHSTRLRSFQRCSSSSSSSSLLSQIPRERGMNREHHCSRREEDSCYRENGRGGMALPGEKAKEIRDRIEEEEDERQTSERSKELERDETALLFSPIPLWILELMASSRQLSVHPSCTHKGGGEGRGDEDDEEETRREGGRGREGRRRKESFRKQSSSVSSSGSRGTRNKKKIAFLVSSLAVLHLTL